MDKRTASFYSGVRTALAVIHSHGADTIFDEVMNTLGGEVDEFIKEAKGEDEYEFAGLDAWEKRTRLDSRVRQQHTRHTLQAVGRGKEIRI